MSLPPGPFRTQEATAFGITPKMLRGRRFGHPVRGVVTVGADLTLPERVAAARLVLPSDAVVIGLTGLQLRGVELREGGPLRFASCHPHPVRRAGIAVRRVTSLPAVVRGDLPVATIAYCFATAGTDLDLVDLVAAGDWLFRLKLIGRERLISQLAASAGRGVVPARRAAALTVADRVDSPRETRLRLCLVLAGLPTPRCNLVLGTENYPIGRVDLVYELYKLILEYEGDQHRWDRTQWNIDIDRVDEFTAEGYVVQRITSARMQRPRTVVLAAYRSLVKGGYRGPEPVFSAEWRRLFEGDR